MTVPRSEARVSTAKADRYLVQLRKHFTHKVPVERSERIGHVAFPPGTCRLEVEEVVEDDLTPG